MIRVKPMTEGSFNGEKNTFNVSVLPTFSVIITTVKRDLILARKITIIIWFLDREISICYLVYFPREFVQCSSVLQWCWSLAVTPLVSGFSVYRPSLSGRQKSISGRYEMRHSQTVNRTFAVFYTTHKSTLATRLEIQLLRPFRAHGAGGFTGGKSAECSHRCHFKIAILRRERNGVWRFSVYQLPVSERFEVIPTALLARSLEEAIAVVLKGTRSNEWWLNYFKIGNLNMLKCFEYKPVAWWSKFLQNGWWFACVYLCSCVTCCSTSFINPFHEDFSR